jgi:hypothetical protein
VHRGRKEERRMITKEERKKGREEGRMPKEG